MPKGYHEVLEERDGQCDGCDLDGSQLCKGLDCESIIWKKDKEVDNDKKELEIFLLDYMSNNIDDIETQYFRNVIEDVLPDIEKVIKHHPLKEEMIEAIKDCIVSNGNTPDNIFVPIIKGIASKLGL